MEQLIKVKDLNFIYNKGKSNEYQALVNINFDVYPEEFIILYGPSGCGKSTILNIIAGLEKPEEGHVFVQGRDIAKLSGKESAFYHRKTIGMIYQAYNLITSLTVLDNVALPQIFLSVRKKKREKRSYELLERFGIKQQAKKIPTELSGGQQQRIGIARSIINDPDIILADEPVGNLDSISAKNVLEILKDLNEKEKKTIILVTHNPDYLEYGDRIFYLKDGVIIKEEVNQNKNSQHQKENHSKAPTAELQELMRAYSGLTPEQISILIMPYKAKVFTNHFISSRNMEETKVFEDVVQRLLLNTVSESEFYDILNRPNDEGGVGFDKRTADKIFKRILRLLRVAEYVNQKRRQSKNQDGVHELIPIEEKAHNITKYLLKVCFSDYSHGIDEVVKNRLEATVLDRLNNKINKPELYMILDKPFKEGGVGLNVKTARAVAEELELILILSFGIKKAEKHSTPAQHLAELEKRQVNNL